MCSMNPRPKTASRPAVRNEAPIDWKAAWPLVAVAVIVFALLVAAAVLRGPATPSPYQVPALFSMS